MTFNQSDQRALDLQVRIKSNQQDAQRVLQTLGNLQREFAQFKQQVDRDSAALEQLAKAQIQQQIAAEKAARSVQKSAKSIADEGKAAKETAAATRQLNAERAKARLKQRNDEFDRVSQDVGLAGDVQSNVGALRGLAGAGGLTGVASGLDVATEVVVLAEELPRLKTALAGLPSTIGAAAAALGPVGIGLAAVAAVAAVTIGQAAAATAKLNEETRLRIEAEESVARFLADATKEQGRERLSELSRQLDTELDLLAKREAEYFSQINSLNPFDQLRAGAGLAFGEIGAANEAYEEQKKLVDELVLEQNELNAALSQNATAANDTAAAERALAAAREANIDKAVDNQVRLLSQIGSFDNAASVDNRVQSLQDEKAALQGAIDANIASTEQLEQYRQRVIEINGDLSTLQYLIRPVAVEREREAQALKDTETQLKALATAQEKYNAATASLEERSLEERQRIQERYVDRLIDIANEAADAADDALRKLEERRSSLIQDLQRSGVDASINLERERLDAQINSAREQAKNARDLERQLIRIRKEGSQAQSQAVRDRDSVALQEAQENQKQQIADATSAYSEQEQERRIALAQELSDQRTQYQRERDDRFRKYQQDLADAQAQYQRELILAEEKRVQALAQLQQQNQAELNALQIKSSQQAQILQNQYRQELSIASQGAQALVRIEAQKQAALVAQANAYLRGLAAATGSATAYASTSTNTTFQRRAVGGFAAANQPITYNEPGSSGRETFTTMRGGNTFALPGAGVFIPSRSGRVNANNNGGAGGLSIPITVNGMGLTKRQVKDEVLTQLDGVLSAAGL